VLIIRMRNVPAMDSTAMHALRDLVRRTKKDGTLVLLSDVQPQPQLALERSELLNEIGSDHVLNNIDEALAVARSHVGLPQEAQSGG
jgi:SulP family sulfate permease